MLIPLWWLMLAGMESPSAPLAELRSIDDMLPPNASGFERALSQSTDVFPHVEDSVAAMPGLKIISPPPTFLPWLVYEYGLGELSPYVPNLYDLIREGIAWQRVRGTPAAIAMGLDWLAYGGSIEEAPTRRRFWNHWQQALDRLRDSEADLPRIEGICTLSDCERSTFWRGFWGYDVRPLEPDWTRWDNCLYDDDSGVRIDGGRAKWSFGRTVVIDHTLTEQELTDLGVWTEPVEGSELTWGDFPWGDFSWVDDAAAARIASILGGIEPGTAWAVFKDGDGDVIGYRRARVKRRVIAATSGPYTVDGAFYRPVTTGPGALLVEALTGFGDGFGSTAESVGFILAAEPLAPHKPGAAWLPAGGLDPDPPVIAERAHTIEFGRTVRERVTALLRI